MSMDRSSKSSGAAPLAAVSGLSPLVNSTSPR
jgi:hypothetical protein